MKSFTTKQFRKCFKKLNPQTQEKAKNTYQLWKSEPSHKSLRFKKIHRTDNIYSVRIGLGFRALGVVKDNYIIWFWIGSHQDYDNLIKS